MKRNKWGKKKVIERVMSRRRRKMGRILVNIERMEIKKDEFKTAASQEKI